MYHNTRATACLLCKKVISGKTIVAVPHFAMECFSKETIFWLFCMGACLKKTCRSFIEQTDALVILPFPCILYRAVCMIMIFAKLLILEINRSPPSKLRLWWLSCRTHRLRCANVYGLQWWGYSCNRRYHSEGWPAVTALILSLHSDVWWRASCRWVVGPPRVLVYWAPWISGEAWRKLQDFWGKAVFLWLSRLAASYCIYDIVYVEGERGELQLKSPTTKSPGSTWFFVLSLQGGKNKASQSALFRASALGLESLCLLASGATSFSTFHQRFCSLQVRKLCSVWFIHVHTLDGRRRVHTLRPFGCWLFHSLLVLSLSFGFGWFGCFAFGVRVQDFQYQAVI